MTEPNETTPEAVDVPTMEDVVSAEEAAPADGVEPEGINAGPIFGSIVISLLVIAVLVGGGYGWFKASAQEAQAAAADRASYPELRQVELEATQLLNKYEVVNAATGTYRIPIDRAMDLIVEESYQAPSANYSQELQLLAGN